MSEINIQLSAIETSEPINPEGHEISGESGEDKGSYFEYSFKTATKLLTALDIRSELFASKYDGKKKKFLFRGHKDAGWPLVPSVYRAPIDAGERHRHKENLKAHWHGANIDYELEPFVNALEELNDLGLLLENESLGLIENARAKRKFEEGAFPQGTSHEYVRHFPTSSQMRTLAIAQHYGLPTRLLDWTVNPYTALFFACNSIPVRRPEKMKLGIWVVPTMLVEAVKSVKFLETVEVPKFQNENIVAQQGLFTTYVPSLALQHFNDRPFPINEAEDSIVSFDQYLSDPDGNTQLENIVTNVVGKPMLFTLPHDEVVDVLPTLDQLNISWTTLMPNLDGAMKEAKRSVIQGQ